MANNFQNGPGGRLQKAQDNNNSMPGIMLPEVEVTAPANSKNVDFGFIRPKTFVAESTGVKKNIPLLREKKVEKNLFYPVREVLSKIDPNPGYANNLSDIFEDITSNKKNKKDYGTKALNDAWKKYLGVENTNSVVVPSKYKKNAFDFEGYNKYLPDTLKLTDEEIELKGRPDADHWQNELKGEQNPMGHHLVKKGKDKYGEYLEYKDLWDFDVPSYVEEQTRVNRNEKLNNFINNTFTEPWKVIENKVFNPFEVYGRQYYKDDGKGNKIKFKPNIFSTEKLEAPVPQNIVAPVKRPK